MATKRQLENEDEAALFPTQEEFELIVDIASTISIHGHPKQAELFARLGGRGLRKDGMVDLTYNDIVNTNLDTDIKFAEVWGKDTTGKTENGKYRKVPLTRATIDCIETIREETHIPDDEPLVGISSRTMNDWAYKIGTLVTEQTGDVDYERYFSPHDLRRYFATNCLVRHAMNMETVMAVGGWEDYATMKNYLAVSSDDQIIRDFADADLLDGANWDADTTPADDVYAKISSSTPMGAAAELSALGADQMAARVETLADDVQDVENGDRTIGRFTPAESKTAVKAGKYGAVVGLAAAGIAGSVPSLGASTMLPVATVAMAAPIAWGWHRSDAAD
ncbi:site-specific integrase (plasmid) [Halobacterium salinarum]|uniref:site-specific integrase n=1 Tax=Halobacterium salinarum TaxID=2242 RepID=UPI0030CF8516